jgi:hypothetical protein
MPGVFDMTHITIERADLENWARALKIAHDQLVNPVYAPIGWSASRLFENFSAMRQALAQQESVQEPLESTRSTASTEPVNLLEARKIAAEYGTPDSQVDDGNLYFALSKCLEHIEALVRADEREQGQRWFDAVTAQHKQMILVEREACAKLAEWEACAKVAEWEPWRTNTPKRIAAAIRARENMTKEALTLDSRKKGPL